MLRSCAMGLTLLLSGIAYAANPPLPTPEDLDAMYQAKAYRVCLQNIARVMALNNDLAQLYDRGHLFLLRGECLLQLDDRATALVAYQAAIGVAKPADAEMARAMVALLQRSPNMVFKPRQGTDTAPLKILDATQRKTAFTQLFNEEWRAQAGDVKAAQEAQTLVPIIKALPDFQILHALEIAGTGKDEITRPVMLQVGQRARDLIVGELDRVDANTQLINTRANTVVNVGTGAVGMADGRIWWDSTTTRAGLSPNDRSALRESMDYLQKINTACQRGRAIALSFGATGAEWQPLILRAADTLRSTENVLNAE